MAESRTSAAVRRNRRATNALRSFLAYLEEIERALMQRDSLRVTALLRKRTATHLPREVREELLVLSRAPRESLRAPVRFLRFQHRMNQLAEGGEGLPTAQTELRLEPRDVRASAGTIRLRDADERRTAAHDGFEADASNAAETSGTDE